MKKTKLINILLASSIVLMLSLCFVPWAGSIGSQSRFPGATAPHDATYYVQVAHPRLPNAIVASSVFSAPGPIGDVTPDTGDFTVIGGNTPGTGAFTELSSNDQYTNTVADGTPPMVITSETLVVNLNVDFLDGHDWDSPGDIGGTTPGAGIFTTLIGTMASILDKTANYSITTADFKASSSSSIRPSR